MPRSPQDHAEINRMLMSHGLGRLEDGAGLLGQLGFLVEGHDHLRSLIGRCPAESRRLMYDSLVPYLHFEAHPLDWYVSETGRLVEAKGLPELLPSGDFKWPSDARPTGLCMCHGPRAVHFTEDMTPMCGSCRRPFPEPDQVRAQDAVNWAFAKKSLTLTCRSCTKQEQFPGDTKDDCTLAARLAGWVYYLRGEEPQEICPDCPATKKAITVTA